MQQSPLSKQLSTLAEKSVPRFRPVVCAEGATRELFEESWGTYIVFRATSMPSCRCVPLGAARRNRPSRRRRVECFRCSRDKQRTLTSPGCRFWNWRTISGDRKALCNDPRAVKTATRVPYLVGHTTGLHLPAPSYILFERVREPRNAMSPLSFLSHISQVMLRNCRDPASSKDKKIIFR